MTKPSTTVYRKHFTTCTSLQLSKYFFKDYITCCLNLNMVKNLYNFILQRHIFVALEFLESVLLTCPPHESLPAEFVQGEMIIHIPLA